MGQAFIYIYINQLANLLCAWFFPRSTFRKGMFRFPSEIQKSKTLVLDIFIKVLDSRRMKVHNIIIGITEMFYCYLDHGIWSHHFIANRWGNSETFLNWIVFVVVEL